MFKKWLFNQDEEEKVEEKIDPVVEERRKQKFSEPLIYNDFDDVTEEKVEKKPAFTPKTNTIKKENSYVMSQIISPFSGVEKEKEDLSSKQSIPQPKIKKKPRTELVPVISPFWGPEDTEELYEEPIKVDLEQPFEFSGEQEDEIDVEDSVENRLRNIASMVEDGKDDLKIIEERTGEFKLDLKSEDSLIDEIDDNMSLDELMNLYEKKFKD